MRVQIPEWGDAGQPRVRKKRVRNRRKPNRRLLLGILCASTALACALSFALQAPFFVIKQVEVRGLHFADRARVKAVAGKCLGQNIFALRKGRIASQIRQMRQVENVLIGRDLPANVWVRVIERKPAAALLTQEGYALLQSNGLAFHLVKRVPRGIPELDVQECRSVKLGQTCRPAGVRHALEVVRLSRERKLEVSKISVDHAGDMCLNMGSGLQVKLGEPAELKEKMSRLHEALLCKPSLAKDAVYINLSCPSACAVKMKERA